jgi:hypothetical protein
MVQAVRAGKAHLHSSDWSELSDDGLIRTTIFGLTYVLVMSPAAQAALIKQAPYLPKPSQVYTPINAMVSISSDPRPKPFA